ETGKQGCPLYPGGSPAPLFLRMRLMIERHMLFKCIGDELMGSVLDKWEWFEYTNLSKLYVTNLYSGRR
ncbi:MAG: hypothetical protein II594_03475, partial [Clostridium sp.]|nr:hypothetical protein [Clostridium sp.]